MFQEKYKFRMVKIDTSLGVKFPGQPSESTNRIVIIKTHKSISIYWECYSTEQSFEYDLTPCISIEYDMIIKNPKIFVPC